ncbi:MAG TPA: GntR family transcriptional regulator [Streptosporangiaceae bacterium]|nr:GntR family transcriptional regulator [Streptosporangiaceae bacterium]
MAQAKYQEIADKLRDQIEAGILKAGERLPSEPDLVKMFDASRNTVRLAIALLMNQGLVVTRQGLGTFVSEPAVPFTALLSRIQAQPAGQSQSTLLPEVSNIDTEPETSRQVVEKSPASASVAEKLEIQSGDMVVIRRRHGSIGGIPWMMMASYFPLDIAAGTPLEQAGDIAIGSIRLLADLGYKQLGFVDEIGARMPNAREFAFFGVSTGTPVLVVNRTAYAKDRPIRLTRYTYRGDRVRLTHEVGDVPSR